MVKRPVSSMLKASLWLAYQKIESCGKYGKQELSFRQWTDKFELRHSGTLCQSSVTSLFTLRRRKEEYVQ
ncbi:MAG TPA: hypothetical protein VFC36_00385 [Paludibacter sp.]|nr:hypothetical protein [Paludibacter sp.]